MKYDGNKFGEITESHVDTAKECSVSKSPCSIVCITAASSSAHLVFTFCVKYIMSSLKNQKS